MVWAGWLLTVMGQAGDVEELGDFVAPGGEELPLVAVPESSTSLLILMAVACWMLWWRYKRRRAG